MANKRERIVSAARARFRHYGIQKTTMQEIAGDADVAVGTLYRYFKDKDDLVVACADEFIGRHQQLVDDVLRSRLAPDKKLRRYLVERFRECREVGSSSRHAAELARAVIRLKPDRLEHEGRIMFATSADILRQGCDAGQFHCTDVEKDARVLLYSLAYFFPNALMNLPSWPEEADFLLVLDWFLDVWRIAARGD